MDVVQGRQNLIRYTTISLVPRPYPLRGKRVWWIWTQSLGQGKEFECSNEIAALVQSYDLPTTGMQSVIACYIRKSESSAHIHAALQPVKFCPDMGLYKTIVNIGNYTAVNVGASLPMLSLTASKFGAIYTKSARGQVVYTVLWALHHH